MERSREKVKGGRGMFLCCVPTRKARPTNDRFSFLVLLNDEDLEERWWRPSYRKTLRRRASELPGTLHIAHYAADTCLCCGREFAVMGMMQVRRLYVQLPKEEIYVELDVFEHELMKSRTGELMEIFRRLGAVDLDITVHRDEDAGSSVEAELALDAACGVEAGIGVQMTRDATQKDCVRARLRRKTAAAAEGGAGGFVLPTWQSLVDSTFYLRKQPDWQGFVRERLDPAGGCDRIEFQFVHHSTLSVSAGARAGLEKCGVRVYTGETRTIWVRMDVDVVFAPLSGPAKEKESRG